MVLVNSEQGIFQVKQLISEASPWSHQKPGLGIVVTAFRPSVGNPQVDHRDKISSVLRIRALIIGSGLWGIHLESLLVARLIFHVLIQNLLASLSFLRRFYGSVIKIFRKFKMGL